MQEEEGLIGPGTDLIVSLSAVLLVLILAMISFYADAIDALQKENKRLKIQNTNLESKFSRIPKKPLVIPLKEASGFKFKSGKSNLSEKFKRNFKKNIIPQMAEFFETYEVNLIEVIGHTDGQPLSQSSFSNLDSKLLSFDLDRTSQDEVKSLVSGSNADLGLVRALAVAQFITKELKTTQYVALQRLRCRVYSAAQLISPATNLIKGAQVIDDRNRRRIELRFTKHEEKMDNE